LGASAVGAWSLFWKYVLFCQVPLTRTYDGPNASASLRNRGFARLMAADTGKDQTTSGG